MALKRLHGRRMDGPSGSRLDGLATFLCSSILLCATLAGPGKVQGQSSTGDPPPQGQDVLPLYGRNPGVSPADSAPVSGAWALRVAGFAGIQTGSTPRRTLELPGSSARRVWPLVGMEVQAAFGPFLLDFAPRLEDRLLDDPDWPARTRGDDRGIALRTPVARLVGEWRWARIELGEVERNWGPAGIPGLLVSPLGYSRRGLGFSVGPQALRFQWRTERLSGEPTSPGGDPDPRWFTAHRLRWRPSERWEVAVWEAMVTSETDGIDPARLNPLALYTFGQQFGIGDERNTSFGFDVAWRAADRLWLETQILVDDIVVWNADENPYPHRFGFTAQARQRPGGAWGWRAWTTALSGLALNTFRPEEAFLDDGRGLGRIRPDHVAAGAEVRIRLGDVSWPRGGSAPSRQGSSVQDSWGVGRLGDGWRPDPHGDAPAADGPPILPALPGRLHLDLGIRWRRQGERRFDDPFPEFGSGPDVPDLPAFSPEIEIEIVALHGGIDWSLGPISLVGESQLQRRRFPASGAEARWGVEARAQLLWRIGTWDYTGR